MIPPVAHFIWYGRELPWVHALAIRSAHDRGGLDRVVLHHADDLSALATFRDLSALPRFDARRIDVRAIASASGADPDAVESLHAELRAPAARANVLRAAILAGEGGLYLDLDTVTVADLRPLLARAGIVCGQERIVFPSWVMRSRDPRVRLRALALGVLRELFRHVPDGWRAFRRIEDRYPLAANNAVLGAGARHPFVQSLLSCMLAMPADRRRVRFALGTHLLQERLRAYAGSDLCLASPEVFYPLPPEISEHWFRRTRHPALAEALHPETLVVHWYASVRTARLVPRIDPAWVRENRERVLFATLAAPFSDGWSGS